jgi:hypothetical protein
MSGLVRNGLDGIEEVRLSYNRLSQFRPSYIIIGQESTVYGRLVNESSC